MGHGPIAGARAGPRRALLHLNEEHARHDGHAAPLRERIDGVTGA
ncbi:mycothiol transferase [Streptomyces viridosporus]